MIVVSIIGNVLYTALVLYLIVMWARFILEIVRAINHRWRPRGVLLVLSEFAYLVTDPPIRTVHRLIPPVRIGGMALDFAWSIVMLAVIVLIILTGSIR